MTDATEITGPDGEWAFADTWILASIGRYGRPCTLTELVAAADAINHALPTDEELDAALSKLTGAGLVRIYDGWTFELTDDGAAVWAYEGRDLGGQLKSVARQLWEIEPIAARVRLPDGALDLAMREYTRGARG